MNARQVMERTFKHLKSGSHVLSLVRHLAGGTEHGSRTGRCTRSALAGGGGELCR